MLHHLLTHTLEIEPARPIVENDGSRTTAADPERLAARLASGLDERKFAAGDVIAHEGDVGDEIYFLNNRQVEALRGDPPQRLTVLREGESFGELAILSHAPRAATIRALGDVEVYDLGRDAVLQLARVHADFNRYLRDAALQYANSPQVPGD